MFGVVSLTMGNSAFPLGDRFIADAQPLRQRQLRQSPAPAQGADEPAGFHLIHGTTSLSRLLQHIGYRRAMNAP